MASGVVNVQYPVQNHPSLALERNDFAQLKGVSLARLHHHALPGNEEGRHASPFDTQGRQTSSAQPFDDYRRREGG
jgi:hypothetical protein